MKTLGTFLEQLWGSDWLLNDKNAECVYIKSADNLLIGRSRSQILHELSLNSNCSLRISESADSYKFRLGNRDYTIFKN